MECIITVNYQPPVTASASYRTLASNPLPQNSILTVDVSAQERC